MSRLRREDVARFIAALRKRPDWNLFRLNPYRFAREENLEEDATLDLFICGARVGLVDFGYELICPRCGGIAHSHHELDKIDASEFYCALCAAATPTSLDDQVEVTFSINPAVRRLVLNPLENMAAYQRYHFSANYVIAPALAELRKKLIQYLVVLQPGVSQRVQLQQKENESFRLVSMETNTSVLIQLGVPDGTIDASGVVVFGSGGFKVKQIGARHTACELNIENDSRRAAGILVTTPDMPAILKLVARHPTRVERFLTAKVLLNNQTFRELFKIQNLSARLNLNIRSLTIMFTDLRGSTEMYDRAGDVLAYSLVQEHFRILTECARRHHGAIIKTMGDAIMATFSTPIDGMRAAFDMIREIAAMNERVKHDGFEIGLKVGLHEGPALAVMRDERLDYFGQTVNIAARVQGLAAAGEIWITDSVASAPEAQSLMARSHVQTEAHRAYLKGVGNEALVYRLTSL